MHLTRWPDPRAFAARATPFLLAHEAHHNLPLGIVATLVEQPDRWPTTPYLATVEDADRVVGAVVMTPPHNPILSRQTAPGTLDLIAADLHRHHPDLPGVLAPADLAAPFAATWHRLTGRTARREMALRIFQLDTVIPVASVPGALRRATDADRDLLVAWFAAFHAEAFAPGHAGDAAQAIAARLRAPTGGLYLWEDDGPRSLAGATGPTPNGIRIGPVYTPPEFRARGYASAAVAALSQLLLDQGRRFCFLHTDLANPTPNRIYQRIGYRPVGDLAAYRFAPPPA